jgi:hypothetical protein
MGVQEEREFSGKIRTSVQKQIVEKNAQSVLVFISCD